MTLEDTTPQSRTEKIAATMAGVTGIELEEPQSRLEYWMQEAAKNAGGGGSTAELPISEGDVPVVIQDFDITGTSMTASAIKTAGGFYISEKWKGGFGLWRPTRFAPSFFEGKAVHALVVVSNGDTRLYENLTVTVNGTANVTFSNYFFTYKYGNYDDAHTDSFTHNMSNISPRHIVFFYYETGVQTDDKPFGRFEVPQPLFPRQVANRYYVDVAVEAAKAELTKYVDNEINLAITGVENGTY